jgi:hypothetical protein
MNIPFNHFETAAQGQKFQFCDVSCIQVGPPIPCNNIKLVDIPDMEYFSAHGQV